MEGNPSPDGTAAQHQISGQKTYQKGIASLYQVEMGNAKKKSLQDIDHPEGGSRPLQIFDRQAAEDQLLRNRADDDHRQDRGNSAFSKTRVFYQIRILLHGFRIQHLPAAHQNPYQKLRAHRHQKQAYQIFFLKQ